MAKENLHKTAAVFEKRSEEGNPPSHQSGLIDTILSNTTLINPAQKESSADTDGKINGIVVGTVVSVKAKAAPLVDFSGNAAGTPVSALSTVPIVTKDKGRDVALAFVNGDPEKPVILGFMHVPSASPSHEDTPAPESASRVINVEKEGETVTISAEKEIVLRCGESSITLTRAGKVLINGAYVSSRSTGVNRIRGGSVLLN